MDAPNSARSGVEVGIHFGPGLIHCSPGKEPRVLARGLVVYHKLLNVKDKASMIAR